MEISPSFLSEIETARGYPSAAVLERLAGELEVATSDLSALDMRSKLTDLKLLLEEDPAWGAVFQELVKIGGNKVIAPEKILMNLKAKGNKKSC